MATTVHSKVMSGV